MAPGERDPEPSVPINHVRSGDIFPDHLTVAGLRDIQRRSYDDASTPKKIKAQDRLLGLLIKYPKCIKYCGDFDANRLSEGFYQKVYRLTAQLIHDGGSTDLMNYSSELSETELSRLTGIIVRFNDSAAYEQEFKDCIRVINDEFESQNKTDVNSLDDDAFQAMMQKLADKNKNKSNT